MTPPTATATPRDLLALRRTQGLTVRQAAGEMDVSQSTIMSWLYFGVRGVKLKSYLFGGRRIILRDDLRQFLADIEETQR